MRCETGGLDKSKNEKNEEIEKEWKHLMDAKEIGSILNEVWNEPPT